LLKLLAGGGVLRLSPRALVHVHGGRRPGSKAFVLAEQMRIERLFAAAEFVEDLFLGEAVAA